MCEVWRAEPRKGPVFGTRPNRPLTGLGSPILAHAWRSNHAWIRHRRLRHDRSLPRPRPGRRSRHRPQGRRQPFAGQRPEDGQGTQADSCDAATDLDAVLARKDIHVVIITTPSGAHMEPAVAAAAAGKHVVVEKPLEITLERCDRIIDACAQESRPAVHHLSLALRRRQSGAEEGRRQPGDSAA